MSLLGQPAFIYRKDLCFAHDYRSFDDVLQFAYVSGPRVRLEQLQGPFVDTPDVLARFAPVAIDEVLNEQG